MDWTIELIIDDQYVLKIQNDKGRSFEIVQEKQEDDSVNLFIQRVKAFEYHFNEDDVFHFEGQDFLSFYEFVRFLYGHVQ